MGVNQERINIARHRIVIRNNTPFFILDSLGIEQQLHVHWEIFKNPEQLVPFTVAWRRHPNDKDTTWGIGKTKSTLTYHDIRRVEQPDGTITYEDTPHDLFGGKWLVILETHSKNRGIKVREVADQFLRSHDGDIDADQPWLSLRKEPKLLEKIFTPKKRPPLFQIPSLPWFS